MKSSSWYVNTLPSLVTIGILVVKMFLVSHVIKQEQAIKGKSGYKDRSS